MDAKTVHLGVEDAIVAARDLNEYVVCLDRIFSRLGTGAYGDEILTAYMIQRDVMPRLARLREKIFDALEEVIGPEESERIAEESYVYRDPG